MNSGKIIDQIKQLAPKEQRYLADDPPENNSPPDEDDEEIEVFGLDIF